MKARIFIGALSPRYISVHQSKLFVPTSNFSGALSNMYIIHSECCPVYNCVLKYKKCKRKIYSGASSLFFGALARNIFYASYTCIIFVSSR